MSIMITPLCHRGLRPQRKGVDRRSSNSRRTCVGGSSSSSSSSPLPNQEEAAKLLLDVRSLALKELGGGSSTSSNCLIQLSPSSFKTNNMETTSTTIPPKNPMQTAPQLPSSPTSSVRRSRLVSVCSMDDEDQQPKPTTTTSTTGTSIMIPTQSTTRSSSMKPVCVTPNTTSERHQQPVAKAHTNTTTSTRRKLPEASFLKHHTSSTPRSPSPRNTTTIKTGTTAITPQAHHYTPQHGKKLVGDTLPSGTELRNVLRKKFSWKSFPELETYLIDHREQYLSFSSSLNYTKAQKLYNNHLTQGLLQVAAEHGYVFEGFTFAAIRDRIRCFYKSYVQAIKKKHKKKKQKTNSLHLVAKHKRGEPPHSTTTATH